MGKKQTVQSIIEKHLSILLKNVEEGKFGTGDEFDRDAFDAQYNDDVLMWTHVYEKLEKRNLE